jgi:hypothetical protein
MAAGRLLPSFETPRKSAAPQDDGGIFGWRGDYPFSMMLVIINWT